MRTITVDLKQPLTIGNETLDKVTLRAYTAGDMARARAFVIKDKRYGPECANDNLLLGLASLRFVVVPPANILSFPAGWAEGLSGGDLSNVIDNLEAVSQGYDDVEAYRAHVRELIRQTEEEQERRRREEDFR